MSHLSCLVPLFPSSFAALPTVTNNTYFFFFFCFRVSLLKFISTQMRCRPLVVLANYSASIRKKIDSTRDVVLDVEQRREEGIGGGFDDHRVNEFKCEIRRRGERKRDSFRKTKRPTSHPWSCAMRLLLNLRRERKCESTDLPNRDTRGW